MAVVADVGSTVVGCRRGWMVRVKRDRDGKKKNSRAGVEERERESALKACKLASTARPIQPRIELSLPLPSKSLAPSMPVEGVSVVRTDVLSVVVAGNRTGVAGCLIPCLVSCPNARVWPAARLARGSAGTAMQYQRDGTSVAQRLYTRRPGLPIA